MNYADDLRILVSVQERNHRKFYRVCENFVNNTRPVRVTDCTKNTIIHGIPFYCCTHDGAMVWGKVALGGEISLGELYMYLY